MKIFNYSAKGGSLRQFSIFNSKIQSSQGFTLIEVMVAVFVFSLMVWGLIALLSGIFTASRQQGTLLSNADQARQVALKIMSELRNAQEGSDGSNPLNTANDQQIVFFSNADTDSSIERIRYFLQSGKLYKGVTEYNGVTYNTSTEWTVLVQNNVANAPATPLFYYYDDSFYGGTGQNPLSQPISTLAVKFVKLNLQIYNQAGVKNTNTYTITASGAIRNLKTNLGE